MVRGEPFEVSKEVYERARSYYLDRLKEALLRDNITEEQYKEAEKSSSFYMTDEDEMIYFSESLRWGYGIYSVFVSEKDGKYICTWERGDSCD